MAICPFLKESMWNGNKCLASGDRDGAPIQNRFANYCGVNLLSDDYKNCPLYKDATGKKDSGGCYLTSACMSTKGIEFSDDCLELTTLRNFRDSYVKENYPEDIDTYYKIAPLIVKKIKTQKNQKQMFNKMYNDLVLSCCKLIEQDKLNEAYNKYKNYSLHLYKKYL
ncbi:hypothetical protein [Clostridium algidicarnis]|uniref:hypothetical protein n=1 Tax=Clostridium algidicarnis TaxID=37659 RepID=UPI00068EB2C1|nr:hypothetical protein [Clostridium algidicarnis]